LTGTVGIVHIPWQIARAKCIIAVFASAFCKFIAPLPA
jgi:hypothetical protein